MSEVKTNPEMNAKIVGILRLDQGPENAHGLYAAALIEELQAAHKPPETDATDLESRLIAWSCVGSLPNSLTSLLTVAAGRIEKLEAAMAAKEESDG